MTIPAHKRYSIEGTLTQAVGGGSEIFSFSIASSDTLGLAAGAAAVAAAAVAGWEADQIGISTNAKITNVRAEEIDATGKVTASQNAPVTPTIGNNSTWTCTVLTQAVTLETTTAGSHGHNIRGRIYPPGGPSQIEGATAVLADATSYATSWATFIKRLQAAGLVPVVASTQGGGQLAKVTGVSADTIVDTQRRRKNGVSGQRSAVQAITAD